MSTAVPPTPDPAAPRASDPTIGRLVADATENLSGIIRDEIALAKAEISVDVSRGVKGGAMFAVAGVLAVFGLTFLLHTIALGLHALGLALWLSYLIVTVVLFVIAGILALVGKGVLSKIKGKPERTIDSAQRSIDTIKRSATGDTTRTTRVADPIAHGATDRPGLSGPAPTPGNIAAAGTVSTGGSGSTEVTER
ncbi:phage holin family protein [Mobilicoccus massiliensis]|uniref:phage holin family protein n=1 Tax=Mobilicoccus massiliensis TaxID=1522310 RepID=UPI0009E62CA1|nr:phage holin family protein [Mobilicoccus massiliensis]